MNEKGDRHWYVGGPDPVSGRAEEGVSVDRYYIGT